MLLAAGAGTDPAGLWQGKRSLPAGPVLVWQIVQPGPDMVYHYGRALVESEEWFCPVLRGCPGTGADPGLCKAGSGRCVPGEERLCSCQMVLLLLPERGSQSWFGY